MRTILVLVAFLSLALMAPVASMSQSSAERGKLTVKPSRFGRIVFDGRGHVVYAFTADGRNRSNCSGACADAWPPVIVEGRPSAGSGARAGLLSTTRRQDGRLQATYAGKPLYYYVGDRRPGQILCQNVREFGGLWLVLRASGAYVH